MPPADGVSGRPGGHPVNRDGVLGQLLVVAEGPLPNPFGHVGLLDDGGGGAVDCRSEVSKKGHRARDLSHSDVAGAADIGEDPFAG